MSRDVYISLVTSKHGVLKNPALTATRLSETAPRSSSDIRQLQVDLRQCSTLPEQMGKASRLEASAGSFLGMNNKIIVEDLTLINL